jgi:hypothetical protein
MADDSSSTVAELPPLDPVDSDDELPDLSDREPADARVLKALTHKDEGNAQFAANELDKAIRELYTTGGSALTQNPLSTQL